jgi:hypothetical protein
MSYEGLNLMIGRDREPRHLYPTGTRAELPPRPGLFIVRPVIGDGIPHGYTSLTPFIVVTPANAAIEFYRTVFGARVEQRTGFPGPAGEAIVAHADLDFGTGRSAGGRSQSPVWTGGET